MGPLAGGSGPGPADSLKGGGPGGAVPEISASHKGGASGGSRGDSRRSADTSRVDSRPLSTDEAGRVRRAMHPHAGGPVGRIARQAVRHEYVVADELMLTVLEAGEGARHFLVRPRNISTCGLGFLHSRPLAPGTACRITLLTSSGGGLTVEAEVIRCCALSAASHVVGIRFLQAIDVATILGPQASRPRA